MREGSRPSPELPRERWRLRLPALRRLVLDARGIPTGEERPKRPFGGRSLPLAAPGEPFRAAFRIVVGAA